MSLKSFDSPESQSNFLNLSVLICHLFVGGKFRLTNILFHPDAIDNFLLVTIDSACPFQISINTFDISVNETIPTDRRHQRTDSILQLVVITPDQLTKQFNRIENLLTFYRVFIFKTSDQLDLEQIKSIAIRNSSSSSLLLVYNTSSNVLSEFVLSKISIQTVKLSKGQLSANEVFNMVFGDQAAGRFLVVSIPIDITCKAIENANIIVKEAKVFASMYWKRLNASFVNGFAWNCETMSLQYRRVRPVKRSFYSDYNSEFELDPDAQA